MEWRNYGILIHFYPWDQGRVRIKLVVNGPKNSVSSVWLWSGKQFRENKWVLLKNIFKSTKYAPSMVGN